MLLILISLWLTGAIVCCTQMSREAETAYGAVAMWVMGFALWSMPVWGPFAFMAAFAWAMHGR